MPSVCHSGNLKHGTSFTKVGDTAFIRARNIERETGLRQIFLKFEGGNPTGTQKDRVAFAQAIMWSF